MAEKQHASSHERRNYYRVEDVAFLEYRPVTQEELEQIESSQEGGEVPRPSSDRLFEQVAHITKQITPLLGDIRRDSPATARFLEGLNKKIDLLASRLFMQKEFQLPNSTVQSRSRINLSAGGVAFNAEQPVENGTYLHVRIGTSMDGFFIETYGRVIGVKKDDRDEERPFRLHVKFPYLDDADRRMLMRHVMAKQREAIRKQSSG